MLFVGQIYRHRRLVQLGMPIRLRRQHVLRPHRSGGAGQTLQAGQAAFLGRRASPSRAAPPITMFSEMPLEILPDHGNVGHRNGLAVGAVEQHAGSRPAARSPAVLRAFP
jgi:hypothetical protein